MFLPAFLGQKTHKTGSTSANVKSVEFHFLKQAYF